MKNTDDGPMVTFDANLMEPEVEVDGYFYVGTLGGIAAFIKNCVHQNWPLGSLRQLLDMMKVVIERILQHPPDKPGKDWKHKKQLAETIHQLIDMFPSTDENAPGVVEKDQQRLHFFELGVHWGVLAALYGEHMSFASTAFFSQKGSEGAQTRWNQHKITKQAIIDDCLQLATNLWEGGDIMMHHTMSDYLLQLDEIKERNRTKKTVAGEVVDAQHVTSECLRKELLPIAKRFARVHGVKKLK